MCADESFSAHRLVVPLDKQPGRYQLVKKCRVDFLSHGWSLTVRHVTDSTEL